MCMLLSYCCVSYTLPPKRWASVCYFTRSSSYKSGNLQAKAQSTLQTYKRKRDMRSEYPVGHRHLHENGKQKREQGDEDLQTPL